MSHRFDRHEQSRSRNIQNVDWMRDDDNFQQDQRSDQQRLGAAYPEDWGSHHGGRQSSYGYREEQGAAHLWEQPQQPSRSRGWQEESPGAAYRRSGQGQEPRSGDEAGEYRGRYYRGRELGADDHHEPRRPSFPRGEERDASLAFASYDAREAPYLDRARGDEGDWGRRDWLHDSGAGESAQMQAPAGAEPRRQQQARGSQRDQPGYGSGQSRGRYRGIGPRNYTRSDDRIIEDLNERLTDDPDIDASNITVSVSNGTATLEGEVEERWMKHRAEDIADSCSGVRDVINNIRVVRRQGGQDDFLGSPGGNAETAAPHGKQSGNAGDI